MIDPLLIFHIRMARFKARRLAIAEALALLHDLNPTLLPGGPLGDHIGVFWITLPPEMIESASSRLDSLGFIFAVDTLDPMPESEWRRNQPELVRWQGQPYRIRRIYEEDTDAMRERAPDQRLFTLDTTSGVRVVKGYRGGEEGKRALQSYDAQMLVNLAYGTAGHVLLDPYAGAGSIVQAAVDSGYQVISGDLDPVLRFGLRELGAAHCILDVVELPLAPNSVDVIVTEPPYDSRILEMVLRSVAEMARVLKNGGKMVMLCAEAQAEPLRETGKRLKLKCTLDLKLHRKGVKSAVLVWEK